MKQALGHSVTIDALESWTRLSYDLYMGNPAGVFGAVGTRFAGTLTQKPSPVKQVSKTKECKPHKQLPSFIPLALLAFLNGLVGLWYPEKLEDSDGRSNKVEFHRISTAPLNINPLCAMFVLGHAGECRFLRHLQPTHLAGALDTLVKGLKSALLKQPLASRRRVV